MKLSVVIPSHNESESLPSTIQEITSALNAKKIQHEILVVNDNSQDNTISVLEELAEKNGNLKYITNNGPNGFGFAVRIGLGNFDGDVVAIMMADLADDPQDLIKFYDVIKTGEYDCVFGNRWGKEGKVYDYPLVKRIINRMANNLVSLIFRIKYNDITNAFKMYRKETIEGLKPFLSPHFNLTLELPLKAIVRGYSYKVLPNSWKNRKYGTSKLQLREMGSRYFFILLYCLIERTFSKGDYKKK